MKDRGEEFTGCLGSGKTEHDMDSELEEIDNECTLDLDWEEINHPIIRKYTNDIIEKGGLNENGKRN